MTTKKNTKTAASDPAKAWEKEGGQAVVGGGFWKPDTDGESLRGRLVRIRHNQGKYKSTVADIRTADSVLHAVNLTTVLEARITDDMLGKEIGLIYRGEKDNPTTGQSYHDFEVFVFGGDLPF